MTQKRQARETEWIVLELVEREAVAAANPQAEDDLPAIEAWAVFGTHTSRSKAEAYQALVGDKTGIFKAIAASAWKGGRAKAQETLVTSAPIDV